MLTSSDPAPRPDPAATPAPGGPPRPPGPPARLAGHAAALALVRAATLALIPRNGSFTTDDGAYAGAVVALRQGPR
ncbi:MAG: hypothetical protein ACK5RL_11500, partial [Acidimicrobiales bacterium]